MCINLFLGVNQELPIRTWVAPNGDLLVSEDIKPSLAPAIFSKPFIYRVGTRWTGDGCGFQGEHHKADLARAKLSEFLEGALELDSELQLFVEYAGPETISYEPWRYDWIGPSDIRTWRSRFHPGEFLAVIKET